MGEEVGTLSVRLKPEGMKTLEELRRKYGAESVEEVVRNALTVYAILNDQCKQDGSITIKDGDGKDKIILRLPRKSGDMSCIH